MSDTPTKQRVDETQECDMGALAYQLAEEMDTLRERLAEEERENMALRAMQVGVKCAYGHKNEDGVCSLGYPGCACMDDLVATMEWGPDDLQAQANKRLLERALAAEALAERNAKDAERYRWLRSGPSVTEGKFPSEPWTVRVRAEPWPTLGPCEGNELDAAIDAARSAK